MLKSLTVPCTGDRNTVFYTANACLFITHINNASTGNTTAESCTHRLLLNEIYEILVSAETESSRSRKQYSLSYETIKETETGIQI